MGVDTGAAHKSVYYEKISSSSASSTIETLNCFCKATQKEG